MQANLFESADDGSGQGAEVATRPAVMFGRQRVPGSLVQDATRALAYFNDCTGRECRPFTARGKPSESLKRIIGAMLDHPETRIEYRRMIDRTLADPWWDGPASTGVIFGPGVVEQSIARAHQRRVVSIGGRRRRNGKPGVSRPEDYDHLFEWTKGRPA